MQPLTEIDIVLSIYNQEKLIERVLYGILENTTTPFNLIIVFDGSNTQTKKKVFGFLKKEFSKKNNLRKIIIGANTRCTGNACK